MVKIVVLGQTLQQLVEEPEFELETAGPTTVQGLCEAHAGKMEPLLRMMRKAEIMITVNRKVGALDSAVKDGDTIKLTHNLNPTYEGAMWQNP